jgi:hypothetical protein
MENSPNAADALVRLEVPFASKEEKWLVAATSRDRPQRPRDAPCRSASLHGSPEPGLHVGCLDKGVKSWPERCHLFVP